MGFSLEHVFVVKAPRERVWAYLTDPYRVAPALPGAAITEKVDEQSYTGTMTIKVGPVTARYQGTIRFEGLDAALGSAQIVARGKETSGRGGADLKMTSVLTEEGSGETRVNIKSDVNVTGALAQFGRGLIQDVSNQMFGQFTAAVKRELEQALPEQPAAKASVGGELAPEPGGGAPEASLEARAPAAEAVPLDVLALGGKVLGHRARHELGQPRFWVGLAIVLLITFWLTTR